MPTKTKTPLAGGASEKKMLGDAFLAIMADHASAVNNKSDNRRKYPVAAQADIITELEGRERMVLFWEARANELEMHMRAWGVPVPPMPKRKGAGMQIGSKRWR